MKRTFHLHRYAAAAALVAALAACASQQADQTEPTDANSGVETPVRYGSPIPESLTPQSEDLATTAPEPNDLDAFVADLDDHGTLVADIVTDHGTLNCELFEEKTPVTVANFVGLARGLKAHINPVTGQRTTGIPYFDDVEFHRVLPDTLIQTGDPTGSGHGGPGYTIPDEIHPELSHNAPGVMSMANRGADTGGSQFFITERPLPHLDGHHTVFGQCEPHRVIRSISHVPTRAMNEPVDPAPRIEMITLRREGD